MSSTKTNDAYYHHKAPTFIPNAKLKSIHFGILSPEIIRTMSKVEVKYLENYEGGKPKQGGLMDPRMGSLDRDIECQTCNGKNATCPGHFGHIELPYPVLHYGEMQYIVNVLRCVCYQCSRLLVDKKDPEIKKIAKIKHPHTRFEQIFAICQQAKHKCCSFPYKEKSNKKNGLDISKGHTMCIIKDDGCQYIQPQYKYVDTHIKIFGYFPSDAVVGSILKDEITEKDIGAKNGIEKKKIQFTGDIILKIFDRIDPEDYAFLGFDGIRSRPSWMILTVLPVAPITLRPTNKSNAAAKQEDPLTQMYINVLRTCLNIRSGKMDTEERRRTCYQMLQIYISMIFDSDASPPKFGPSQMSRINSKKNMKGFEQKLKGKEGRIRGNLMGKRVKN